MMIQLSDPISNIIDKEVTIDTNEGDYSQFENYRVGKILEYDAQYLTFDLAEIFDCLEPTLTYIDFTECELSYNNAKKVIEFFNKSMKKIAFHEIKFDFSKNNLDEDKSQELYDMMISKSEVYRAKGNGVVGDLPKTKEGAKMAFHTLHAEVDDAIDKQPNAITLDELKIRSSHPILGPKLSDESQNPVAARRQNSANEDHDVLKIMGDSTQTSEITGHEG